MFDWIIEDSKAFLKIAGLVLLGIVLFTASFYPLEGLLGSNNLIVLLLPPQLTKDSFWIILADMTWVILGSIIIAIPIFYYKGTK